jgi:acyl-CoA thioesterase I
MTLMLSQCILSIFLLALPAHAQSGNSTPQPVPPDAEANLSPECRVAASELYALAPLRGARSATDQKHALKVLALGPTSATALAPGTGLAPFPTRLEHELEKVLPGVDVTVEGRSLSGEITAHASPTIMKAESV